MQTNHALVGWIGLAVTGAPIANGRGYILIRGVQENRFVFHQVQKPGGKCVLISHSSISRALWCLRGPGYIKVSNLTFNQNKFNQIFTLKVTLREAQRLNSTPTCSVVVPGCPDNFFLTGHIPPSRKPFLEEVVNDRGKYSIEFNMNVYLNLP